MALGFEDLQETVIILHPAGLDEWGDPITPGTGTGTGTSQITVGGCLFAPGATREIEVNGDQVQADGTLFVDPTGTSTSIAATDQIRIRGELYEVAGKPRYWNNNFTEIPVRRVTG